MTYPRNNAAQAVSIVIAVHNAAKTLRQTLQSVLAQSTLEWEAIIVDDGSEDRTGEIALAFAKQDSRFRVLSQLHSGVSAARNKGIDAATFPWLLFLNAGDQIHTPFLEVCTKELSKDSRLDAAYCRWRRVFEAREFTDRSELLRGDLFPDFAVRCVFTIQACLVRRLTVQLVQGFDTSFDVCEDWDLLQRIARTGAKFGAIDKVLVDCAYKQPGSSEAPRWLAAALRVLSTGHGVDQRLAGAAVQHPEGFSAESLAACEVYAACSAVATFPASCQDLQTILVALAAKGNRECNPITIANSIFSGQQLALLAQNCAPDAFWNEAAFRTQLICQELWNHHIVAPLGPAVARTWERLVFNAHPKIRPWRLGASYAIQVEVTKPISNLQTPAEITHLYCTVCYEDEAVGTVELPVFDGFVSSYVLEDAVAAELAWQLLGRYLRRNASGRLRFEFHVARHLHRLRPSSAGAGPTNGSDVLDVAGWTVFLQEIWGLPSWPLQALSSWRGHYLRRARRALARLSLARDFEVCGDVLGIEVGAKLSSVRCNSSKLELQVTVGGSPLGTFHIPVEDGVVHTESLIAAITNLGGYELCRLVVRQALVGRPSDGVSLRQRLSDSATRMRNARTESVPVDDRVHPFYAEEYTLSQALPRESAAVFIPRYNGPLGTAVSRRAHLPGLSSQAVIRLSKLDGSPLVTTASNGSSPRVVYAPELIRQGCEKAVTVFPVESGSTGLRKSQFYDRVHWEGLFAVQRDPWRYGNRYEQVKYEQTLSLVPADVCNALEVACAEGWFTEKLAKRVQHLVASDISQIAVDRAARRCAELPNVELQRIDMLHDELPAGLDLVVCSEVLYYMENRLTLSAVATKLANALRPGGYLLTAHPKLIVDDPKQPGFDWGHPFGADAISDVLHATADLRLQKEIRTRLYRIQLYCRGGDILRAPEIIEQDLPAPLPPEIAKMVHWRAPESRQPLSPSFSLTACLPILTYHSVNRTGPAALAPYRVVPKQFEEQIAYLHDAGYYSATFNDWRIAAEAKKPLPGHAIILTFDDGYKDFSEYAWPILKHYGFSAVVFLVAGQLGGTNAWDRDRGGSPLPLMDAGDIQRLQQEGVEFGSHCMSHRSLLTLHPEEAALEYITSSSVIREIVGRAVDAVSYPYGYTDRVLQHLAGACGYLYGVSTRPAFCRPHDSLLGLPRIEIRGHDTLETFIAKLTNQN